MTDWYDEFIGEDETDEDIIELTDITYGRKDRSAQEGVIELTEIVDDESTELEPDSIKEEGVEVGEIFELEEETFLKGGLEPEIDEPMDEVSVEPEELTESIQDLNLSQEQVEAALELVIEKKFADKIEIILHEVTEKVIEKEIVEIKKSLQKDLDQMGNA